MPKHSHFPWQILLHNFLWKYFDKPLGETPFSPGINNARPPIHQEREVGGHVPIKQFAFFRSGIFVLRKDLLLFFQQQKNIILFEKIKSLQQTPPPRTARRWVQLVHSRRTDARSDEQPEGRSFVTDRPLQKKHRPFRAKHRSKGRTVPERPWYRP